jgi:ABC-2 type transport system permease protein
MSFAIFRVMLLGLIRDRGALAMAFLLPPLIYLIFASIFAGAAGDELQLRIAVLDEVQNPVTKRLTEAILAEPNFRVSAPMPASRPALERLIRQDHADAGVVIKADPSVSASGPGVSPILVLGDPAKAMAAAVLAGHVQRIFSEKMPDAAYRRVLADFEKSILPFTPDQRPGASASLKDAVNQRAMPPLVAQASLGGASRARAAVVYYAGAVAILFLMYAALHSAVTLIDERQNGIMDRILQGASGVMPVLTGKFLFLVAQGIVQASLIFLIAALVYGVEVLNRWPEWLLITIAAAAATAALALALAAACHTRQQAQTLSTFLVLVLAALGGSMVPQFLMPAWLQQISWTIPNAWIIEAYHRLLWRDAPLSEIAPILEGTVVFTLCMLGIAYILLRPARLARA